MLRASVCRSSHFSVLSGQRCCSLNARISHKRWPPGVRYCSSVLPRRSWGPLTASVHGQARARLSRRSGVDGTANPDFARVASAADSCETRRGCTLYCKSQGRSQMWCWRLARRVKNEIMRLGYKVHPHTKTLNVFAFIYLSCIISFFMQCSG